MFFWKNTISNSVKVNKQYLKGFLKVYDLIKTCV